MIIPGDRILEHVEIYINIRTQSLFDCMFKTFYKLDALYREVPLGLVLKNLAFTPFVLMLQIYELYCRLLLSSFNVFLQSLDGVITTGRD